MVKGKYSPIHKVAILTLDEVRRMLAKLPSIPQMPDAWKMHPASYTNLLSSLRQFDSTVFDERHIENAIFWTQIIPDPEIPYGECVPGFMIEGNFIPVSMVQQCVSNRDRLHT